jgi:hypothetical protein
MGEIDEGQFHVLSGKGTTGRVLRDVESTRPAPAAAH